MDSTIPPDTGARTAGYAELVERLSLQVIPNWHESTVAPGGTRRIDADGDGKVDDDAALHATWRKAKVAVAREVEVRR